MSGPSNKSTDNAGDATQPELPGRIGMRDAVVEAALNHAAFDGWSHATLKAAAADADILPADIQRLFPRGTKSLLDALDDWLDRKMLEACGDGFDQLPVRKKIATLVRGRFEPLEHYKESTRRAVVSRGWPSGVMDSGQSVWRTVDRVWARAGFKDSTTDGISYYSRRAILAGVLASTCLYWLEDASENSQQTWRFLDARIDGVLRFGKAQRGVSDFLSRIPGMEFGKMAAGRVASMRSRTAG